MFKTLINGFKDKDIRKKLIITFSLMLLFIVGTWIPTPGINISAFKTDIGDSPILKLLSSVSGGALSKGAVLALGVSPYIFASIVVKIASLAYDAVSLINSLAKDGEIDRKDLLNPNGWTGINGIFRFKSNGSSERNMDIKEIVGGSITKTKIISPASVNFLK